MEFQLLYTIKRNSLCGYLSSFSIFATKVNEFVIREKSRSAPKVGRTNNQSEIQKRYRWIVVKTYQLTTHGTFIKHRKDDSAHLVNL